MPKSGTAKKTADREKRATLLADLQGLIPKTKKVIDETLDIIVLVLSLLIDNFPKLFDAMAAEKDKLTSEFVSGLVWQSIIDQCDDKEVAPGITF